MPLSAMLMKRVFSLPVGYGWHSASRHLASVSTAGTSDYNTFMAKSA